ncbi:aminotransferase class I/II-fold pyridoxal phosphate-dependent enzyme [Kitasatospora gansuensis]
MRFDEFQEFRQRQLSTSPSLLDAAETNVYRALAPLRPEQPADTGTVYRCDLARAWLRRFELPEEWSRRAMVSRGVRHGLGVVFHWLHSVQARLWLPSDVYPVYFDLARAVGLAPASYPTLPTPALPSSPADDRPEYLLLANPSKPLGRYLSDAECAALIAWLQESPHRHLLIDCVYDLGAPFAMRHPATAGHRARGPAALGHQGLAVATHVRRGPAGPGAGRPGRSVPRGSADAGPTEARRPPADRAC